MNARLSILLLFSALLGPLALAQDAKPLTPPALQEQVQSILPDLLAATVAIGAGPGYGSGVIITPDGIVITAAHVITKPGTPLRFLLADGRDLPGTALGVDHSLDAGIARIDAPGPFPFCPCIQEKTYGIGDWVVALGHPGGPHVGRPTPVRLGRINRDGTKSGFSDPITSTAFVISGDSGGPLFDLQGRVIGINSNVSGDWNTNNHVPLPAFLEVWDRLLNSEEIAPGEKPATPGFDDPFRVQRDYFLAELAKRPDDPAAHLLTRPRLLDPHHIQAHLDRWAIESAGTDTPFDPDNYVTGTPPEPKQPPVAHLGLRFDLSAPDARIIQVLPGSPAATAGLAPGDRILALGDEPTTSARAFLHALRRTALDPETPAALSLRVLPANFTDPRTIEITPRFVPARRYFRQPLAILTDMMMSGAAAVPVSAILRDLNQAFIAQLPKAGPAVLSITLDDKPVILATAVTADGDCITKASEVTTADGKLIENLETVHRGKKHPVSLRGIDSVHDIALLHIPVTGLTPALWSDTPPPATATLLISPQPDAAPLPGIVTQPTRPAPKIGYDHPLALGDTPPFLGVRLGPVAADEKHPTVALIEAGSPAENAGFLEGDLVTAVDGEDIATPEDFAKHLNGLQPGRKLTVTVLRGDRKLDLTPILGTRTTKTRRLSPDAIRVDQALLQLSAWGGKISTRRQGFPNAIYHDTELEAHTCGGPLLDLDGRTIGLNISRSLRHRTLAIPAASVRTIVQKIRHDNPRISGPFHAD